MNPAYSPVKGSLYGIDFVVYEPALAQAAYPEQAQRIIRLSSLCHAAALSASGEEVMSELELAHAAEEIGFRVTVNEGVARVHRDLKGFLAWQSAAFMTKTSGFQPMDRFFAVAQGQTTVNLVYGIGSAKAYGTQLQLLSTRELCCVEAGELLDNVPGSSPAVFGEDYQPRVWLVPEMDFPCQHDYQALARWANKTVAARS